MKTEYLLGQGAVSAAVAWLAARLGLMLWPLAILAVMMVIDYITGMLASKTEAILHPGDPAYGWSSRKGLLGILKKTGYLDIIAVGVCKTTPETVVYKKISGAWAVQEEGD